MDNGMMTLIARSLASAERSFHKSLTTLSKLQSQRGFVPQKPVQGQTTEETTAPETDFVPQKTVFELEAFERMGYFPEDAEKYVKSILDSGGHLPEKIGNAA